MKHFVLLPASRRILGITAVSCLLAAGSACQANAAPAPAATVSTEASATVLTTAKLTWLTGTWRGPIGKRMLEEQWTTPSGGSVAALIRFNGDKGLAILELVSITDHAEGLELRIAQWSPTMEPLAAGPQLMRQSASGERTVTFSATAEGGLRTLKYTSPDANTLIVSVEQTEGNQFDIRLQRVVE